MAEGESVNGVWAVDNMVTAVPMKCLCCDSANTFRFKVVNGYALRKCDDCGLEYCGDMPTEETLAKFYAAYRDPLARPSVVALNARRNITRLGMKGRVLDFGCGENDFAMEAQRFGLDARGEDYYKKPFGEYGPFDWITLWGVLEHLTDPLATLIRLRARLVEKGRVALTTVSIETPIPYRHKPPEHTLYFTSASLRELAIRAGFRVMEYRPYTMVQDSDVYLNTLLRTMPDEYQGMVTHTLPQYVEIPTNEVFVVLEKC